MSVVGRWRARHRFPVPILFLMAMLVGCDVPRSDYAQAMEAYQAKRYEEARPLLVKAAQAGNNDARAIAGSMLVISKGGPADAQEGMRWLTLAGESGHATAQMMLGTLYAYGTGVNQNTDAAKHWLGLAAKQGDGQAAVLLNQLNGKTERAM